ncbi:hypothetical protein H6P81_001645 [Aristolochia fimbriata]|uniref:Lon N-terminal domain-containing protein n=1 Tax=Aristolochia fimbriata TaxID=158543 RepID=A0AAV7FAR0_ARIFI|nr:hypothetical protein H6P81_001645 [Aristolochia fimbriata]
MISHKFLDPNLKLPVLLPRSNRKSLGSCATPTTELKNCDRLKKCRQWELKASYLDLPLLPFESDEVLVPSECKTLHLYEARFLALLEESLLRKKRLFVHFVLDPIIRKGTPAGSSFAARYGCLVLVENVETLEIGALVSIRGIGRVSIVKLKQTSKDELLQTRLSNSLRWAEKEPQVDCDKSFIPTSPERISFAALQPVSGSTNSELLALRKEKIRAMDMENTADRLANSLELVKTSTAMLAAKLAIQSLET